MQILATSFGTFSRAFPTILRRLQHSRRAARGGSHGAFYVQRCLWGYPQVFILVIMKACDAGVNLAVVGRCGSTWVWEVTVSFVLC